MTKLTVLYAVFVALLVLVLVRRHTRGEEEAGRAELIGATVVGRGALLAAAGPRGGRGGGAGRAPGRRGRRRRRAAGDREPRVRGLLDRDRAGGGRPDRARVPALRQQPHLRRRRGGRARPPLRAARRRRRGTCGAVLGVAVRVVDPAAGLGRAPLVGPAAGPRARGRPGGRRRRCCASVATWARGVLPARPGPPRGQSPARRRVRADLAGAPGDGADLVGLRGGPGRRARRHRAGRGRPARQRGRARDAGVPRRRRGAPGRPARAPCSRSPRSW